MATSINRLESWIVITNHSHHNGWYLVHPGKPFSHLKAPGEPFLPGQRCTKKCWDVQRRKGASQENPRAESKNQLGVSLGDGQPHGSQLSGRPQLLVGLGSSLGYHGGQWYHLPRLVLPVARLLVVWLYRWLVVSGMTCSVHCFQHPDTFPESERNGHYEPLVTLVVGLMRLPA